LPRDEGDEAEYRADDHEHDRLDVPNFPPVRFGQFRRQMQMIRVHDERAMLSNQATAVLPRALPVCALLAPCGLLVLLFERGELGGELRRVALLPFFVAVAQRMPDAHSHFTFFRKT
jgi:hypothetical protein